MAVTTTTIAYALKRLYPQRRIENLVYQDNPFLALIAKKSGFGGSVMAIAARYADTMGRSSTFTDAQSNITYNRGVQFLLSRVKDYQLYSLETEAILAGKTDRESFVRTLDTEVESAINNASRSLAIQLYGDGYGSLGQVSGVTGAGPYVFTMTNAENITNIEVGQVLTFSTGSTQTAILRNSGGGVAVVAVDRDAGTFTTTTNPDSGAGNDWVFVKGDRQVAAITAFSQAVRIAGLEAWNPATAPAASESFFGVDRSADASRLGGLRIDVSSNNPEEGIIIAMNRLAREGGRPSHYFLNYKNSQDLQLALGAKAVTEYTKVGDIGFTGIRINGPKGDVMVYPDQNAPVGVGRLLTLNTWTLNHLGELINTLDLDGGDLSREYNADRFEGRMAFYGNLGCVAPGMNARVKLV